MTTSLLTPAPDPLVISWRLRELRVRHNGPRIGPHEVHHFAGSGGLAMTEMWLVATGATGVR